ncbi:MAG: hypothetical protein WC749_05250 [Dehalococcoidia bacterium]
MGLEFYEERVAGAALPHPPISLSMFLVVEEALCVAWDYLKTNPRLGFDLVNAVEDVITHELYERLYDEIFNRGIVDGFDRQLFTVVTRESKVRNYDGAKLDKMPDLLIGLSDRLSVFKPSQDWIFIECKPADPNHSVGTHYCNKGIIRFVRGEYAWAMTSALMIGYVPNGYSISSKLSKALKVCENEMHTIALPCPCQRSKAGKHNDVVHISQHSRTFRYIETNQQAPAITIRHLWLHRD